eukprot:456996_1
MSLIVALCLLISLNVVNAHVEVSGTAPSDVSKLWQGVGVLDTAYISTGDIVTIRSYKESKFLHQDGVHQPIELLDDFEDNHSLWKVHHSSTNPPIWCFATIDCSNYLGVDNEESVKEKNNCNDKSQWKKLKQAVVGPPGDDASPRRSYTVMQNVATGKCLTVTGDKISLTDCGIDNTNHLFYFEIVKEASPCSFASTISTSPCGSDLA